MGSPSAGADRPGEVVLNRGSKEHQLAGAVNDLSGSAHLLKSSDRKGRVSLHGQYDCKTICQLPGRDLVLPFADSLQTAVLMGGGNPHP